LEFYYDVEKLKNEPIEEQKILLSRKMCSKYIIDYSPFQINIDASVKDKILNSLENNDNNLLEHIIEAQRNIFDILREDSFPRFLQCKEFRDWDEYKKNLQENVESP